MSFSTSVVPFGNFWVSFLMICDPLYVTFDLCGTLCDLLGVIFNFSGTLQRRVGWAQPKKTINQPRSADFFLKDVFNVFGSHFCQNCHKGCNEYLKYMLQTPKMTTKSSQRVPQGFKMVPRTTQRLNNCTQKITQSTTKL